MQSVTAEIMTLSASIGFIVLAIALPAVCGQDPDDVRDDDVVLDKTRTRQRLALLAAKQKLLQANHTQLETDVQQQHLNLSQQIHSLQQVQAPQPQVNFLAHLSHDVTKTAIPDGLIFDSVVHNVGHAYDSINGRFTAPYTGLYFFALTTTSIEGDRRNAAAGIRTNAIPSEWLCSIGFEHQLVGSCQITIHLGKGQYVWMVSPRSGHSYSAARCTFSGFLIAVDI